MRKLYAVKFVLGTLCCLFLTKHLLLKGFVADNIKSHWVNYPKPPTGIVQEKSSSSNDKVRINFATHYFNGYSCFQNPTVELVDRNTSIIWIEDAEFLDTSKCLPTPYTKSRINETGRVYFDEELNLENYRNSEPLIPKIIHQQWNTYDIPLGSKSLVESVVKHHPDWEYWFWTEKDRNCYVETKHPELLRVWKRYARIISHADVMRYIMVHDFGGFYFDLDNRVIKPIDVWRYLGPAFLHHTAYENVFFWYGFEIPNIAMSTIGSRPKHPFFKQLINGTALECLYKQIPWDVPATTGPLFLSIMYRNYIQENLGNFAPKDDVQVVHPK